MVDLMPNSALDVTRPAVSLPDWPGDSSRIDLHVHSYASGFASNWWVRALGLGAATRESYTAPDAVWSLARDAGLEFVTLTDHESLGGANLLAGRPEFLMGVEINAVFPDDGSVVDILIYGLDNTDHREIQARRGNVYHLLDYLQESALVYVLAHPLFDLGGRLGREQIEKRMVLFPIWEWINGSRPESQNRLAAAIAASADASQLRTLALRHGLRRPAHERISGTGGSDDHGGVSIGRAWTRLPRVASTAELLDALRAGESVPEGQSGTVASLAHTAFAIAARALEERPDSVSDIEPLATVREFLPIVPALPAAQIRQLLAARYEARLVQSFPAPAREFRLAQTLASIGRLIEGHLPIAPYIGIHGYFGHERQKSAALGRDLGHGDGPLRIGIVVDDLEEIHGVATMYRNLERIATEHPTAAITLIRCQGDVQREAASPHLRAIAMLPLPLYPGRVLGIPSLLDVFDHVEAAAYDVIVIATPGPLGVAALVAATTLGIPAIGAYHTEYAAYARLLSGDHLLGNLVGELIREFYGRCAKIAASSHGTAEALRERGFAADIAVLHNGVDSVLFTPGRRDERLRAEIGQGRKLLVYVGRVSREKDLDWLAAGYADLRSRRADVHLVIVGDGPHRAALEAALGDSATFTGFLAGESLARTVSSCDLFVFPSTTDTLGRAILEAQACGVPAVVRNAGGAPECVAAGRSGIVVDVDDTRQYWAAVADLLDDLPRRQAMGTAARDFATQHSWETVLAEFVALCDDVVNRAGGTAATVNGRIAVPV